MSSNTSTATAVVAHAAGDLRVEAIEVPAPAVHETQIAIAYGGICGSDLHYWSHGAAGESILKAPMVLGHEIVGTVTVAAADGTGPAAGTAVAVHPATPGDTGARYPEERPNLSPGCTYLGSAARYPHTEGAFATTVNLPARMLRALPAGLSLRDAALAEPAAVAWHAVGRAGDVSGKRVMVIGAGPIGALAVAVLKRAGAAEIIAVDMFDYPLDIAIAAGATATLKADDVEAISAVEADVVIEASGNYRGLASAVRGAMRGGRVVMVGLLPSGEQPALISLTITRELELVGSFRFNDEIDQVLTALADGSLDLSAVITHEFDVNDALQAFEVARNSAESGKVLLKF
ncbi:L-idonate 5-dehydrogenase [Paeniglutamicibacter psychrophenolicus]|uniref:L-idonate 5-dehydrogenase n=1 Tax=Paeniglutamicibacter psychrophenolicus TaxID=257454 RepID=A0ABS4WES2_9MICC|nr:zinc-binding dehydrogenase [Paeniglutamicibacter psychrophenolicus]MBP2374628.1 L-idonate 5-dehydrogenase [Paeniglutamicibacter psychrophenolicus]